jgi:hypothetical protein
MNTRQTQLAAFGRLLDIMDDLREMSLGQKANHAKFTSLHYRRNV